MRQLPEMDSQVKTKIINALIDVVKSAPQYKKEKFSSKNYSSDMINQNYFDIWMKYVDSILKIISRYIDVSLYLSIESSIQNIAKQQDLGYAIKTKRICNKLLDFAKDIIDL